MKRDHLLGWPPALLALDPEPKVVPPRIILREPQRLTEAEQRTRAKQDQMITAQLPAPTPVSESKIVPESKIQYFMRTFNDGRQDAYRLMPEGILWFWSCSDKRWNRSKWTVEQAIGLSIPIKPVDTKPSWVTADA